MASIGRYGIDFYGLALYGSNSTAVTTTGTTSVTVAASLTTVSGDTVNDRLGYQTTATVTSATSNGSYITYTASNTFSKGQTVSITGLSTDVFNLNKASIYSADLYTFTVLGTATGPAVTNSAGEASAISSSWNSISLHWDTPGVSSPSYWTDYIIVRNQYGFPVTPFDGVQVYSGKSDDTNQSFVDNGLPSGYYYYAVYLYVYNSFTNSFSWISAATSIGLSVSDLGNTTTMYNALPEIFKISTPYTATMDWDNPTLKAFLSNFGFQLDQMQTQVSLLERRYNIETVNGTLIPALLKQFGLQYEDGIGMQQNRILLRDSIILTSQKGSLKGLTAYLKDFTGYGVSNNIISSASIINAISDATTGTSATALTYYATNVFSAGEYVTITGVSPSDWNVANAVITSAFPDRFTIAATVDVNPGSYSSGGKATISAPNPATAGIVAGHNLMLDYNDSSFEESIGSWASKDATAVVTRVNIANITSASYTSSGNTAVLQIGQHTFNVGNKITVSNFPLPIFNQSTAVAITAVNQVAGTISYQFPSTYASNISSTSGFNNTVNAYATVTPFPLPWSEPTAPSLFPNKTGGLLTLQNALGVAGQIDAYCGDSAPTTKGIPVTPGLGYCFSLYTAQGATARAVTVQIKWYDRNGSLLSATTGTAVTNNVTSFSSTKRPYAAANAPTNAVYAVPGIIIAATAAGEFHYFDAAQFEQAYVPTSFDEARQMHITLKANRINELVNPHFATPLTPWTISGSSSSTITTLAEPGTTIYSVSSVSAYLGLITLTTTKGHTFISGGSVYVSGVTGTGYDSLINGTHTIIATSGVTQNTLSFNIVGTPTFSAVTVVANVWTSGNTLQVTSTGTTALVNSWDGASLSQLMSIYYPGTSYTFSVYVQSLTNIENINLNILWYDISHTLLSTSTGSTFSTTAVSNTWVRPYVTATAPANAAYASVQIQWPTASIGDVIYIDSGLFENSGLLLTYFDGSTGPGLIPYDFIWEGNAANAGRSHFYQNRYNVQNRLANGILKAQLHAGATAAFYLAQPGT